MLVVMDLVGSVDPFQVKPYLGSEILDNVDEYIRIRDLCLQAYPALECLNKKRFNYINDLSYYEADILTQALLSLKKIGVVAYPVHDCLIVRLGNEFDAVQTFKKVFKDYVYSFQKLNNLPKLDLDIALSVKFDTSNKIRVEGASS